jgi:DNA-binding CsgD family transcriptional regulator
MVGRDEELAHLIAHLEALPETGARAVEVIGEAGIGKTLLLAAFTTAARERGARVFSGRASEFEREAPFAALTDALTGLPHGLDDEAAPTMRHIKHRAVRTLLEDAAAEQPAILIIDDLHWADGATVDLLASLVDRPPSAPVLLVLGHRPFQLGSPVPAAITHGAAAGRVHRIALGPLSLTGAASLLGGRFSSGDVASLHAACGGNPFVLQQVGRRGSATLLEHPVPSAGGRPQTAVDALLATELAPLSPSARQLLDGAALAGDPFEIGLAAAIAEVPSDAEALAALDELVAADLIRPTSTPRAFAFRHPMVRHSVYERAGAGWRLAAHRRAADALQSAGAAAATLAHHVEQCAAPGDEAAIALLAEAGRQVMGRAPASATRWLRAAWSLVPPDRQLEPASTDILYGLGLAMTVSGDGVNALELDAATIARLDLDHPVRVRFELGRAMIEEVLARFDASRRRLLGVAAAIGDAATLDALTVTMTLATLEVGVGDIDAARRAVERGIDIADRHGFPGLDAFVLPVAAWVNAMTADLEQAAVRCDGAVTALAELDDAVFARYPSPIASLMRCEWALGRLDAAREHADRGLLITSNGEWPILGAQFLSVRAMVDVLGGRLREALDGAEAACEEAALIKNFEASFWAHTARSAALEPTSAIERAVLEGELAVDAAREQGMRGPLAIAGQVLGRALLSARRPDRAIATILETHGGADLGHQATSLRAESFAMLCSAELARGDAAAAERWLAGAESVAAHRELPLAKAFARAAAAELHLHRGEVRQAAELAELAAQEARALGAGLAVARFALLQGRALVDAGDRTNAPVVLRGAEQELARFGADRLQAAAVRQLRRLGLRVTRGGRATGTSPAPIEALTHRQREIAELVVAGHANRVIAERLFVSVKTVETHLSATYVKLGVSGRDELIARVRAGLDLSAPER